MIELEKEILMEYITCCLNEGFGLTLKDKERLMSIGIIREDFKKNGLEIVWDNAKNRIENDI